MYFLLNVLNLAAQSSTSHEDASPSLLSIDNADSTAAQGSKTEPERNGRAHFDEADQYVHQLDGW